MWIKLRNDRYINAAHIRKIEGFLTHEFSGEEGDDDRMILSIWFGPLRWRILAHPEALSAA